MLSGDIEGDDITNANGVVTEATSIIGTNNFHVVNSTGILSDTVLDGFYITAGQANGDYKYPCGDMYAGGMYNINGNPTLMNVIFYGNSASYGGGMYILFGSPILANVSFSGNSAGYGGGILSDHGDPTLNNVVFSRNNASRHGGGVTSWVSSPTLTGVKFSGNYAGDYGGGMFNSTYSNPKLNNVTFSGNKADIYGGGINSTQSGLDVRNGIFWNNQDSSGTGTFSSAIDLNSGSTVTLTHSLVQGSGGSSSWIGGNYIDGGNNLDLDPLFITPVDPSTAPTSDGDLHLSIGSPAIDAGNNTFVIGVPFDLDGNPRIMNGIIDMGAYETYRYVFLPLIMW